MAVGVDGKWKIMFHVSDDAIHEGQVSHIQISVSGVRGQLRAFFTDNQWYGSTPPSS